MTIYSRCLRILGVVLVLVLFAGCRNGNEKWKNLQKAAEERSTGPSILISPGDAATAKAYYKSVQTKIAFTLVNGSNDPSTDLNQLLASLGYKGISAANFEHLDPKLLMPKSADDFTELTSKVADPTLFKANMKLEMFQDDKVLVSRFFAPKIVDYTNSAKAFTPGWRKLVSLKDQTGSADVKIERAYVLFNFVQPKVDLDPFAEDNVSKNNQVILVPKGATANDASFFTVFGQGPTYPLVLEKMQPPTQSDSGQRANS